MIPASTLLNAWDHLVSHPNFLLVNVLVLNVRENKDTVIICMNLYFVGKNIFSHSFHLKEKNYTTLSILNHNMSMNSVLWYLNFMEGKQQQQTNNSSNNTTQNKTKHFYINVDIVEKCHYWVSYLFLSIHEWIMTELTWAIVHYLLFLWVWCLAEVLKV